MKKYFKKCPICNKDIYYTNKYNLKQSIKNKVKCKSCGKKKLDYDKIISHHNDGFIPKEIANEFNSNEHHIRQILIKLGLKPNKKHKSLIGCQFGKLLVLEQINEKIVNGGSKWLCKCECGKLTKVLRMHLTRTNNSVRSCGCLHNRKGSDNPSWIGFGQISGVFWNRLKNGAKRRNIQFSVDIEYIWDLFIKQNKKCALSGLDLKLYTLNEKYKNIGNASIDRIDSSKGYIKGNVQWVHQDINYMKLDFDEKYFIELCSKIVNNKCKNLK